MGKHRSMPGFYGKNIAMQAKKKYLKTKKTESQRTDDNREAAANVIGACYMMALNDLFGIGEARLFKLMDAANAEAERFNLNKNKLGFERAKKKLDEEVGPLGAFGFMLPVTTPPKKKRDWELLGERRDAAESVVKIYIQATKKTLGFGPDRLERVVRATEQNFRDFGGYAKEGDYYGYDKLAKRLGQMFHTQVGVMEEKMDEPIFGKSLT